MNKQMTFVPTLHISYYLIQKLFKKTFILQAPSLTFLKSKSRISEELPLIIIFLYKTHDLSLSHSNLTLIQTLFTFFALRPLKSNANMFISNLSLFHVHTVHMSHTLGLSHFL